MKSNQLVQAGVLFLCLVVCMSAGFAGSLVTAPALPTWYKALAKPAFTPPDWVFAPVWTTLYVLMGVSLFLVVREGFKNPHVVTAVGVFSLQLLLNVLWSFLFFGMRSPIAGFAEILLLLMAVAGTIAVFMNVSVTAGLLQVPYLLWITFALYLNYSIMNLNPPT